MFALNENREIKGPLMSDVLGSTLIEMASNDPNVLLFSADLAKACGLGEFITQLPDQMFDCGIQEANMIGTAAATSEAGMIPFAHTFAAFASRKCIDQIFLAACYPQLNLKIIGSDPGITATTNGASHMGLDDMGMLNSFHNITLLDPSDSIMLRELLLAAKNQYGVHYIRQFRKCDEKIYREGSKFEIGKGNILKDGEDVTIIATGIEVPEAMEAAELLAKDKIDARIVDMFTWRPIDRALILRCAKETGAIVTAENHILSTGLGSIVASIVAEEYPVPMGYIGVNERFGEVGSLEFLKKKFNMKADDIAEKARQVIKRKRLR